MDRHYLSSPGFSSASSPVQDSCLPQPHVMPLLSSSGELLHEPPENLPSFLNKSLTDMAPTARTTSIIDISMRLINSI